MIKYLTSYSLFTATLFVTDDGFKKEKIELAKLLKLDFTRSCIRFDINLLADDQHHPVLLVTQLSAASFNEEVS